MAMKILSSYETNKSKILDLLRDVSNLAREVGCETPRMKDLVRFYEKSLKTGKINIGVVGEWNNGKSALINALLGCELLLSANKECTAAITKITYSEKNYIKIYRTSSEDQATPLVNKKNISPEEMSSILCDYTTTWGNDVETEVECVEIGWPYPVLDKNITIIDTPGVNSHNEMRSTLTYSYLPQCHAILVLIDANKPGTTFDLEFIRQIKNKDLDNIFFIMNKVDSVSDKAVKEGMETLRKILSPLISSPKVIGISALAALYSELPKQSLVDLKTKGEFSPGLQFIKHGDDTVGIHDPGYSTALFELSNISSLHNLLGQYFVKEYGLQQFFANPLSFIGGILDDLSACLEDRLKSIQANDALDKLDEDIVNFEKKISKYDHDSSQLRNEIGEAIDTIKLEYTNSMKNVNGRSAVYDGIAKKISSSNIDELTAKKNVKLNILVQNAILEYVSKITSEIDRQVLEVTERMNTRLNDIAQDIQTHTSTKSNNISSATTDKLRISVDGAVARTDSTKALAATGVFGSAAAAAVWGVSGTTLATGFTFGGISTGFGAVLPFLASNPVGWAVGAALVTGGLGYVMFKKKPNAVSIVEKLRKCKCVENTIDQLLSETETFFESIKSKTFVELTNIVNDLVTKARRLLDDRKIARSIEDSEVRRKVGEIEDWIRSTRSLQEKLSAASEVE